MASTNTQFSIAVHLMTGLGVKSGENVTSSHLASSVNACPSFVRRVISKLSKAGLVHTEKGKMGACALGKKPSEISLLSIYKAISPPGVFAVHTYPADRRCVVSRKIKPAMATVLAQSQNAMEAYLAKVSLQDVINNVTDG